MNKTVKLAVSYKSQLDNYLNPLGACNVTSIAMCLEFLGVDSRDWKNKLEDEIYEYMENRGLNRHSPQDLALTVRHYGRRDDFTKLGTIERCQKHLANGNPCVIHGYFTNFGHIIVLIGYDERGFIVHDPYGEWFESGYRTDLRGEGLHYSYNLFRQLCMPDNDFWVHYIS